MIYIENNCRNLFGEIKMKKSKLIMMIKEYPLVFLMALLIYLMFALYLILPERDFSEVENRYLSKKPALSWDAVEDGSFEADFDTYTSEQIPLRDEFIRLKSICESVIGKCENNGIIRGKNSELFEKSLAGYEQYKKNISSIGQFVGQIDNDVVVAFCPNATEVISDSLPVGSKVLDEEYMEEYARGALYEYRNVEMPQITDVMKKHADEYIYYRTDHHWTTMGAYYGYEEIAKSLEVNPVDIGSLTKKSADGFYGTLYAKYRGMNIKPDSIEYYESNVDKFECDDKVYDSLYDEDKLSVYDKYAMFMYGNSGHSRVICKDMDVEMKEHLIVFKDSYANCLIPFLTYNYKIIDVIDLRYYKGNGIEEVNKDTDADVLLLYNFSHLNEDKHFFKLTVK